MQVYSIFQLRKEIEQIGLRFMKPEFIDERAESCEVDGT
jgi:hypothetical protein